MLLVGLFRNRATVFLLKSHHGRKNSILGFSPDDDFTSGAAHPLVAFSEKTQAPFSIECTIGVDTIHDLKKKYGPRPSHYSCKHLFFNWNSTVTPVRSDIILRQEMPNP